MFNNFYYSPNTQHIPTCVPTGGKPASLPGGLKHKETHGFGHVGFLGCWAPNFVGLLGFLVVGFLVFWGCWAPKNKTECRH